MRWWTITLALLAAVAAAHADAPAPSAAITRPLTLTDTQVRSFLDAVDELRAMGDAAGTRADASRPAAFAEALRVSGMSQAIIGKHGFADVTEFQRVAYHAAMAYGVLKRGGPAATRKDLDKAAAEQEAALDRMRQHMTPEQIAALRAQMQGAMATATTMQDVPPGNVEVVERYRERFATLGRR